MTIWLLIMLSVSGARIEGAALVAPFLSEEMCIAGRQHLSAAGHNIRHSRCVEVSIGEGV